jgi:hypothetical protein
MGLGQSDNMKSRQVTSRLCRKIIAVIVVVAEQARTAWGIKGVEDGRRLRTLRAGHP